MTIGSLPRSLHVEPSGACNLRCIHCRGRDFPKTLLSEGKYHGILDAFLRFAVPEQVHFCGTGEPLINPDLTAMLAYTRSRCPSASIKVTTNLSLPIRHLIDPLVTFPTVVSISVDGATRDTYESIRRNGDFELVSSNISMLAEQRLRLRGAVVLNVNFTPSIGNLHEIRLMPAYCASVGADALLIWRISDLRDSVYTRSDDWRAGVDGALSAAEPLGIQVRVAPIPERTALPPGSPAYCRAPEEWLNVTASGRLAPCCEIWEQPELETWGLPTLPETDIVLAWQAAPLVQLREALHRGEGRGQCGSCHWFHHPFLSVGTALMGVEEIGPAATLRPANGEGEP